MNRVTLPTTTKTNLPSIIPPPLIMHTYVQEAVFVAAVIGSLVWAYNAIPAGLQEVKDAARSPAPEEPKQPQAKQLDPDAENKIELDTLQVLSQGHSFPLRNAAIKIVTSRATNNENRNILLRLLASSHEHDRDKAINALSLLFYGSEGKEHPYRNSLHERFQDRKAFDAIVTALVNLLPYHEAASRGVSRESLNPPSPIRPLYRSSNEKALMRMLIIALRGGHRSHLVTKDNKHLDIALDAGLVSRWLQHYPFPCALPQFSKYNYKKYDVCSLFGSSRFASDDEDMHEIIRIVSSVSRGANQLRAVGLKASRITENMEDRIRTRRNGSSNSRDSSPSRSMAYSVVESEVDSDIRMIGGEGTAGEHTTSWTQTWPTSDEWDAEPHPRVQDRSQEENALRRRNREAVVVAERGQPLGRDNILRRQDSGTATEDHRHPTRLDDVDGGSSTPESMPELEALPNFVPWDTVARPRPGEPVSEEIFGMSPVGFYAVDTEDIAEARTGSETTRDMVQDSELD